MEVLSVKCQQFNVNDTSYAILDKFYKNGDKVKRNDILFVLDSSKAALDIESDAEGFFYSPLETGEHVSVGQVIYIISKEAIADPAKISSWFTASQLDAKPGEQISSSKIITKSAKKLMQEHKLTENDFAEAVITEEVITAYLNAMKQSTALLLQQPNFRGMKRLALIGAGQGFVQVLDILFNTSEYIAVQVYDDTPEKQGAVYFNIPVKGKVDTDKIISDYKNGEFDAVINTVSVSIGFRKKIFSALSAAGIPFANLIHPTAHIGFHNSIGQGNVIFSQVSVGPCTVIGNDNFVSAHCNLEHHNVLGDHCTFGPGVMTSGSVKIGNQVKFGTGIFIEPLLSVGDNVIIASGSIITRNIESNVVAYPHGSKLAFKNINS